MSEIDQDLAKISFGDFLKSDPSGSYSYLYVQKPNASLAPVIIFDGGAYYHGRLEFCDNNGDIKAVIKSDGSSALYFDMRDDSTGILMTVSGGVPIFNFTPNGDIKDSSGHSMINSTTLGSYVVNSSLTSVGTLSNLSVSGDIKDATGNTIINSTTIGPHVVNSSLTSFGTLSNLSVSGDIKDATGNTIINSTTIGPHVVNSSLTSFGTLANLSISGDIKDATGNIIINSTTLGTNIVNSSLTSFGTLSSLSLSGLISSTNSTAPSTASHIGYSTSSYISSDITGLEYVNQNITSLSLGAGLWSITGSVYCKVTPDPVTWDTLTIALNTSNNTISNDITTGQISRNIYNAKTTEHYRLELTIFLTGTTTYYLNAYTASKPANLVYYAGTTTPSLKYPTGIRAVRLG